MYFCNSIDQLYITASSAPPLVSWWSQQACLFIVINIRTTHRLIGLVSPASASTGPIQYRLIDFIVICCCYTNFSSSCVRLCFLSCFCHARLRKHKYNTRNTLQLKTQTINCIFQIPPASWVPKYSIYFSLFLFGCKNAFGLLLFGSTRMHLINCQMFSTNDHARSLNYPLSWHNFGKVVLI